MSELPEGWTWAPLEQVVLSVRNGESKKPDADDSGVPILRISAVRPGRLDLSDRRFLVGQPADYERSLLREGDVLFTRYNGNPELVGACAVVPPFDGPLAHPDKLIRVRVDPRVVSSSYLVAMMRTGRSRRHIDEHSKTAAGQVGISGKDLKAAPIPVPPANEQRRIVAKIEALQERSRAAREALEAIPPLLDRFRQSVLAAAFRGDLTADWRAKNPNVEPATVLLDRIRQERRRRWEKDYLAKAKAKGKTPENDKWKAKYKEPEPVDEEGLPELPQGWCWAPLEEVTCAARRIRYGILKPGPDFPGGIPYIKVLHMRGDVIDVPNLKRTSPEIESKFSDARLKDGDLLVSIRGTYGRVAEIPASCDGANITQDSARVVPLPGMHRHFLAMTLRSPYAQGFFETVAKGVAVKGVNIGDLRRTPVPVAPELEQAAVAAQIEKALESFRPLGSAVADAERLRGHLDQSILAKAFRGELVPQDPNDEPASVLLDRIRAERDLATPKKKSRGRKSKKGRNATPKEESEPAPSPAGDKDVPQFMSLVEDDQLGHLWDILLGEGPLELDAAIRLAADKLRDEGAVSFKRLRKGGKLYTAIEEAIEIGLETGHFDGSEEGHVRAVLRDPGDYQEKDWRMVVDKALNGAELEGDDGVRVAVEWAEEKMGLEVDETNSANKHLQAVLDRHLGRA